MCWSQWERPPSVSQSGGVPFGLTPAWKYPPEMAVYLKGQPQVDITGRDRILLCQNEGWAASLCGAERFPGLSTAG